MERNLKKGIASVLALMMILPSAGFSYAAELPDRTATENGPSVYRWVGLNTVGNSLTVSSKGVANPAVWGTTRSGEVDTVNVAVSLKRSSGSGWSTIKTWNQDIPISYNTFAFDKTYKVGKNYSYKFSATVKSYKGGVLLDSVTFDSKIVKY
jgi:hypothetical protein